MARFSYEVTMNKIKQNQQNKAVRETTHLLSIPNMGDSIRKGLKTRVSKCAKRIKWN